ncbi:hypothetical protein GCM10011514_38740 [Emticicia aquatilis]|uniref:DUF3575 domain-containing protein n=1 Tax=Emticicia aquatilis TaxID=1537369 RepID=A0A916Z179_9BACT|nr:hypothetical protein [Emticicia aquatilis]GGD70924.1 hypothetical protein GCM10011514_38740 [Emticicia aquatilis]
MKKYTFLIASFVIFVKIATAQDSLDRKHLIVKIAPLTIFDIDNTFEFSAEHSLSKNNRWTLSEQLGYGAGVANIWQEESSKYGNTREHYRVKLEARRYRHARPDMTGGYMAYEVFYKQVNDRINRNIGRECENGPCNYYENLDYPASKYVVGGTIKAGYQHRFKNEFKKNTNFVFDLYIGLGIRRVMIDHKVDVQVSESPWFYYGGNEWFGSFGSKDRAYNIPHASFGIRFGYFIF